MRAASAAGMNGIAALWGDGKIERLEPINPIFLAYTPTDILKLLHSEEIKINPGTTSVIEKSRSQSS
ncbi:hypothetical protein [Paenibacillus radicis (ex Xue et al. 2023)]|uniref:hypothetical protein n=1 Tax=Paenibacillus radicis (ex Xue et al. 2023) TaxID=2972489 RepID=UPI003AF3277E